jgi:hypothetical protein
MDITLKVGDLLMATPEFFNHLTSNGNGVFMWKRVCTLEALDGDIATVASGIHNRVLRIEGIPIDMVMNMRRAYVEKMRVG